MFVSVMLVFFYVMLVFFFVMLVFSFVMLVFFLCVFVCLRFRAPNGRSYNFTASPAQPCPTRSTGAPQGKGFASRRNLGSAYLPRFHGTSLHLPPPSAVQ